MAAGALACDSESGRNKGACLTNSAKGRPDKILNLSSKQPRGVRKCRRPFTSWHRSYSAAVPTAGTFTDSPRFPLTSWLSHAAWPQIKMQERKSSNPRQAAPGSVNCNSQCLMGSRDWFEAGMDSLGREKIQARAERCLAAASDKLGEPLARISHTI